MPERVKVAVVGAGQAGLSVAYYLRRFELVADEDFTILDLLIDRATVAVRWKATVNVVTSGQTYETELADFIEMKDGKIVSFVEFLDTALAG